jgi:hypothetical protein
MVFEIPLSVASDEVDFSVTTDLDGKSYTLAFSYSAATDQWYFDCYFVTDAAEPEPLVLGIPCIADYPLLAGVTHADRPAGELQFCANADPGKNDLGLAARLYYFDADELTA